MSVLTLLFRTPEEDAEEIRLKEELKNVDAALKKLKKLVLLSKSCALITNIRINYRNQTVQLRKQPMLSL